MEEYIKKLLEQVRFQKAHKAIEDEIRAHIEDQIEDNMSEGMDKETAEKRAVEDMGNPVDVGIELDKRYFEIAKERINEKWTIKK